MEVVNDKKDTPTLDRATLPAVSMSEHVSLIKCDGVTALLFSGEVFPLTRDTLRRIESLLEAVKREWGIQS